jgi:hypothetical protein
MTYDATPTEMPSHALEAYEGFGYVPVQKTETPQEIIAEKLARILALVEERTDFDVRIRHDRQSFEEDNIRAHVAEVAGIATLTTQKGENGTSYFLEAGPLRVQFEQAAEGPLSLTDLNHAGPGLVKGLDQLTGRLQEHDTTQIESKYLKTDLHQSKAALTKRVEDFVTYVTHHFKSYQKGERRVWDMQGVGSIEQLPTDRDYKQLFRLKSGDLDVMLSRYTFGSAEVHLTDSPTGQSFQAMGDGSQPHIDALEARMMAQGVDALDQTLEDRHWSL